MTPFSGPVSCVWTTVSPYACFAIPLVHIGSRNMTTKEKASEKLWGNCNTILTETITSEKKYKSRDFGFSLGWTTKAKTNLRFSFFISVGCCWAVCVTHKFITKANAKENLEEFIFPFHYESGSEKKSPDFHL